MKILQQLSEIRSFAGSSQTKGLPDDVVQKFAAKFPDLVFAVKEAYELWTCWKESNSDWLKMSEAELVSFLQEGYVNFYKEDAINPYVSLAAKGPWVVTTHGAVIHDSGGYGMLGFGQAPDKIMASLTQNYVMANIMTAHFSQRRLSDRLFKEIGQTRQRQECPFAKFICMNSGSEAMTVASRISDIQAKTLTDHGGRHAGKTIRFLSQKGSFHGRTERPARVSDSNRASYSVLASYRETSDLDTVEAGNTEQLNKIFAAADQAGVFYEAMFIEPVMGEGNPGKALPRDFYDAARRLTRERGTLLVIDSIQAGIRATGYLSICDYPGFEDCEAPDMEVYSKALNAGQYPLSVIALTKEAAALYKKGVYGNTMTTNPRALEVACAVLECLTPEIRKNIRTKGDEFVAKFKDLQKEFPDAITRIQGTGLLFSVELNEKGYVVLSKNCVELDMRKNGFGVIHGGKNALRFTPHFGITSEEVDLVVGGVRQSLLKGPIFS
jgi:acetylornithine/succinyldiaminopimelate/putrescine aminotransferase